MTIIYQNNASIASITKCLEFLTAVLAELVL
jgi:hypothetical protein